MISFLGLVLTTSIYIYILYILLKPSTNTVEIKNHYPDLIKNFPDRKRKYER